MSSLFSQLKSIIIFCEQYHWSTWPLQDDFPGLLPLIERYLDMTEVDVDTSCTIKQYLNLISARASGKHTYGHQLDSTLFVQKFTSARATRKFALIDQSSIDYLIICLPLCLLVTTSDP